FLSAPDVADVECALLLEAFDSGWIAPLGPQVDAFEQELATYLGIADAAALSSGSAALHLALVLLGIGAGDDVIVPTLTFIATAAAVTFVGARPVFVDSDERTGNLDAAVLEAELDARSQKGRVPAAVVGVDLYGQCAEWDAIGAVCGRFGVPLIEDGAEALGATYHGEPA